MNHDWLKEQCNRLKYGYCHTAHCLKRDGWKAGEPLANRSGTCEVFDTFEEIEKLKNDNERLQNRIFSLEAGNS